MTKERKTTAWYHVQIVLPLWARFYTLEDNRPFFSDRDGVKKFDISEIGHERRNGYSWYNSDGLKVLKKYEQWKKRIRYNDSPQSNTEFHRILFL